MLERQESLLIIEDDRSSAHSLSQLLSDRFRVWTAEDAESGLSLAIERLPSLVLMDIRLPRQNGLSLCASLRQDPRTFHIPIIMMTGHDSQETRTTAYRSGADDYLKKPFSVDELLARIESKMRRIQERVQTTEVLIAGNLRIDTKKMEAFIEEKKLQLSALEFKLLKFFVSHQEEMLTRDKILQQLWQNAVVTPRTIDTHVSFLRKKIARSSCSIDTHYGAGYVFRIKSDFIDPIDRSSEDEG